MTTRYAGFDLTGRVVVVTGGGGGLGSAMAAGVAAAGAAVAIADADPAAAGEVATRLAASGARALAVSVDVTDATSVEGMVGEVDARLGPIDGLVNSHGTTRRGAAADYSIEDWGGSSP